MPLVGAAWLPWWTVAGLVLALAVTHREGEARSVRTPLVLLGGLAGLVALLPGLRGPAGATAFIHLFLSALGGTALTLLAVTALEERQVAWGAAWLGALLLIGPLLPGGTPPLGLGLGFLALVLVLLGAPSAEERPALRLEGGGAARRVAGAGLLAAALLALLALALPGARSPGESVAPLPPSTSAPQRAQDTPVQRQDTSPGSASAARRAFHAPAPTLPGTDLVLVGGVLLLLAVLFLLGRLRGGLGAGRRPRPWEVAAVLGLVVTAVLAVVFAAAVRSGTLGGPGAGAGGEVSSPGQAAGDGVARGRALPDWFGWLGLLSFLVLVALAGAVFWLALGLRPEAAAGEPVGATPDAPPPGEFGILHRVRAAYRSAQAALLEAGLARGETETPGEHVGRVTLARPELAGPLGTLVAAYAPVRYGGRVTDEDAEAAERAAREVAGLLRADTPTKGETP